MNLRHYLAQVPSYSWIPKAWSSGMLHSWSKDWLEKCDQFPGLSAFLVELRLYKYSNFAGPSVTASPKSGPIIQTCLAHLKAYPQIQFCPAYQTQYLDFIYFLKRDDFPLLAGFCVWHYQLKLLDIPLHSWSLGVPLPGGSHLTW